jgi:hypothetical protein
VSGPATRADNVGFGTIILPLQRNLDPVAYVGFRTLLSFASAAALWVGQPLV